MTYLYASLGILMMSSIMAIIEMSMSITKQPLKSTYPEDNYLEKNYQLFDKEALILLKDADSSWSLGDQLCSKLLLEASNRNLLIGYARSLNSVSEHPRFIGSCALGKSNHRIVISRDNENDDKYNLYSCYLKEDYCIFEQNP